MLVMKIYECKKCGWTYDYKEGDLKNDIEPGVKFIDLNNSWNCPKCSASKEQFVEKSRYQTAVKNWEYSQNR